jgi:hypothetical protein
MKTLAVVALLVVTSWCLTLQKHETEYKVTSSTLGVAAHNVTVSIRPDGTIVFNGCNVNINGYSMNNGAFSLTRPLWVTTLTFCFNDPDPQIRDLFASATKAVISNQTAIFYNNQGQQIMTLSSV